MLRRQSLSDMGRKKKASALSDVFPRTSFLDRSILCTSTVCDRQSGVRCCEPERNLHRRSFIFPRETWCPGRYTKGCLDRLWRFPDNKFVQSRAPAHTRGTKCCEQVKPRSR